MATPLTLIIRYISTAVSGCVLMMWGVMNLTLQLRAYLAAPEIESEEVRDFLATGWTYSWIMAVVVGLIPFTVGVVLLRGVFKEASRARRLMG